MRPATRHTLTNVAREPRETNGLEPNLRPSVPIHTTEFSKNKHITRSKRVITSHPLTLSAIRRRKE